MARRPLPGGRGSAPRLVPIPPFDLGGLEGYRPYKAVCTHGWVVDGEGRKQSKSLGNVNAPSEVIDEYGADILRL